MKNTTKYRLQEAETTSYSVAHYILVFLLICIGVIGVGWLLIAAGYRHQELKQERADQFIESETIVTTTTPTVTTNSPCVQQAMNDIAQMWAYNPNDVPQKYWEMAVDYLNGPVEVWTEGACNDIRYICNPGQIRRECDPCAVSSAMSMAMDAHTRDTIAKKCPKDK